MEAKDLMIGDWVKFKDSDLYHKVYAIQGKRVKVDKQYWHKVDKLFPIPLTTEILEKNGFKKDERNEEMYYWNWGISDNCVSYNKETNTIRIFHTLGCLVFVQPLSYVHELQHALKLCGIEKEIVL